jgi:hypothetical protein
VIEGEKKMKKMVRNEKIVPSAHAAPRHPDARCLRRPECRDVFGLSRSSAGRAAALVLGLYPPLTLLGGGVSALSSLFSEQASLAGNL